jgi:hypothetical protein
LHQLLLLLVTFPGCICLLLHHLLLPHLAGCIRFVVASFAVILLLAASAFVVASFAVISRRICFFVASSAAATIAFDSSRFVPRRLLHLF